jgi:hypothetical protein
MTTYYIYASITQRSFPSIWRMCWRLYRLAAPLVFVHFSIRKLLRLPRTVYWGFPRPERIDPLPATALPFVVRKEFEAAERACQAAGMRHIYYARPPHIGGAQRYAAAYLSTDGTFYTGIVWNHFAFKGQTRASTVFTCHTPLTAGTPASFRPNTGCFGYHGGQRQRRSSPGISSAFTKHRERCACVRTT